MPVLIYYKCDMCGRTWRQGKNPDAVQISLTITPVETENYKGNKKGEGMFCGANCCELAMATVVRGLRVQPKTDRDREKEQKLRGTGLSFGSLFGGGIMQREQADDEEEV